jgi:hypothetical protein
MLSADGTPDPAGAAYAIGHRPANGCPMGLAFGGLCGRPRRDVVSGRRPRARRRHGCPDGGLQAFDASARRGGAEDRRLRPCDVRSVQPALRQVRRRPRNAGSRDLDLDHRSVLPRIRHPGLRGGYAHRLSVPGDGDGQRLRGRTTPEFRRDRPALLFGDVALRRTGGDELYPQPGLRLQCRRAGPRPVHDARRGRRHDGVGSDPDRRGLRLGGRSRNTGFPQVLGGRLRRTRLEGRSDPHLHVRTAGCERA